MEAARNLFEQLKAEGELLIDRMVTEGEQESLFLDFKTTRNQSAPMQEDDRKTLAEAISGFANSDGGLIVWGVDCRSGATREDPDVAQGVKPIANLARWLSDLNQYTHQVASPEVLGVEHFVIPKAGEADTGYAVTFVPKANGQPVMAIAKKKEQYCYFIRSGASFVKMESFMVADRYNRRPQPKLQLVYRSKVDTSQLPDTHGWYDIRLIFGIKNVGLGLAMYPALEIKRHNVFAYDEYAVTQGGLLLHSRYHNQPTYFFGGGTDDVIYPGRVREVAGLRAQINPPDSAQVITIQYKIYCDGFADEGSMNIGLGQEIIQSQQIARNDEWP